MNMRAKSGSRISPVSVPEEVIQTQAFEYAHSFSPRPMVEIDVLRAEDGETEFEIHVELRQHQGMMIFHAVRLATPDGRQARISGPNGGAMDLEMAEVTLWEAIEDSAHWVSYTYGRSPTPDLPAEPPRHIPPQGCPSMVPS